jgi:hypothetical protein
VHVLMLSSHALPDAGDLLGVDEVFEGREVFATLRASGEEEVFGDVEESWRTRSFLVATSLDEEVPVDEIADHGVGVDAAGDVNTGAGDGTQVEDAGENFVGCARERGRAGLLAKPLDGGGAERVCRELEASRDLPKYDAGRYRRVASFELPDRRARFGLGERGSREKGRKSNGSRANQEDGFD